MTTRLYKGYLTKTESDGSAVPILAQQLVTWPKPNQDDLGQNGPQSKGKSINKCSGTPSRLLENPLQVTTSWSSSKEDQGI